MNLNQLKGYWKNIQNKLKLQRDRISNAEIMQIGCDKEEFVQKLYKNYENEKNLLKKCFNEFIGK
jgi:hypothetical protein